MRYPDGTLVGDLGDQYSAQTSGSLAVLSSSLDFDENDTQYDLLPITVNQPPVIVGNIVSISTPTIQPIQLADGRGRDLFVNGDGIVRVCVNTSFTLRFAAEQPNNFNVENGIPVILPDTANLVYNWKLNQTAVYSFSNNSLGSSLEVNGNTLTINRVQSIHAGTYSCDVENDSGVTSSESITIEVYEPDSDPLMYTNLVRNSIAQDGTAEWESNNSDFVVKEATKLPLDKLKTPNRVDLFGYTVDMLHPRPYQIDAGQLRGYEYDSTLTSDLKYFSRAPYKYLKRGGTSYVKAYQDIDLSDVVDAIKGGIYGINGLTAVFSCYIGNAISSYQVVREVAGRDRRTSRRGYFQGAPRLSIENRFTAGPGEIIDRAYITIEEYQDETRLSSFVGVGDQASEIDEIVTIADPWTTRIKRIGDITKYYDHMEDDTYGLDISSPADAADRLLFVADELVPNYNDRFTYAQYAEFSKLTIDKLNPKTNKIRLTMHFVCDDERIQETWSGVTSFGSGECLSFTSYDPVFKKNSFSRQQLGDGGQQSLWSYINNPPNTENNSAKGGPGLGQRDEDIDKKFFFQPDPRPMITGIGLSLIPILREELNVFVRSRDRSLVLNSTPTGSVPNALRDIPFDPLEKNRRNLYVTFKHRSIFSILPNATTVPSTETLLGSPNRLTYQNATIIGLKPEPGEAATDPAPPLTREAMQSTGLFPFAFGQVVDVFLPPTSPSGSNLDKLQYLARRSGVRPYSDIGIAAPSGLALMLGGIQGGLLDRPDFLGERRVSFNDRKNAAQEVGVVDKWAAVRPSGEGLVSDTQNYPGTPFDLEGIVSEPQVWQNKSRFVLYYNSIAINTRNWIQTGTVVTNPITGTPFVFPLGVPLNYTPPNPQFNAYYVEIDFSSNPNGTVTFSRDSSIPGYGEIEPILAEHGFSSGSVSEFYFKIPDQVLYRPFESGGLGFPINGGGVRATSLFLAHAAPYGSTPFEQTSSSEGLRTTINGVAVPTNTLGGTPTLGYDPDGIHYYYVVYRGIQDQVISNGDAT